MIRYVTGDATEMLFGDPKANKILAHICNDENKWGSGVVMAISKRWKTPEKIYRSIVPAVLGTNQLIEVEQGKYVCNMVAQNGFSTPERPACDLNALAKCLWLLNNTLSLAENIEIHTCRLGCGLGGRKWPEIQPLLEKYITRPIYVYDFV